VFFPSNITVETKIVIEIYRQLFINIHFPPLLLRSFVLWMEGYRHWQLRGVFEPTVFPFYCRPFCHLNRKQCGPFVDSVTRRSIFWRVYYSISLPWHFIISPSQQSFNQSERHMASSGSHSIWSVSYQPINILVIINRLVLKLIKNHKNVFNNI
jgi:hypothetical protein